IVDRSRAEFHRVGYRDLLVSRLRVFLPAFESSLTALTSSPRSAGWRFAAFGLTDGPNGLPADQAVANLMMAIHRKSGENTARMCPPFCALARAATLMLSVAARSAEAFVSSSADQAINRIRSGFAITKSNTLAA